jgi:hypothetical protein
MRAVAEAGIKGRGGGSARGLNVKFATTLRGPASLTEQPRRRVV